MYYFANVVQAIKDMKHRMKTASDLMTPEDWQGVDLSCKGVQMVELLHQQIAFPMKDSIRLMREMKDMKPNFPWVEDHFQERISENGVNPGVTYKQWPWYNKSKDSLDDHGMFNHNYMERYWPNHASNKPRDIWDGTVGEMRGIRGRYGDLENVVNLLIKNPTTRQAYLPVWFPEDTGDANPGRKPCTLGYHFIIRNNQLDITYHIRSCDFYRHFVDDIYLTILLAQEVLEAVNDETDLNIEPGKFIMNITSLHMFLPDYQLMFKQKHLQETQ